MTGTLSDVNHHFYYVQWQGITYFPFKVCRKSQGQVDLP